MTQPLDEVIERRDFLVGLTKTPGWEVFLGMLGNSRMVYAQKVREPVKDVNGTYTAEYAKGALSGIELAMSVVKLEIEALNTRIGKEPKNADQ